MQNEILIRSLKLIMKFILWNILSFSASAALIYFISEYIDFNVFLLAFLMPVFIPSFIYLAYSIYKLNNSLKEEFKYVSDLGKTLNVILAIVMSLACVLLVRVGIFFSVIFVRWESLGYLYENFLWFGVALFLIIFTWKVFKIFSKENSIE